MERETSAGTVSLAAPEWAGGALEVERVCVEPWREEAGRQNRTGTAVIWASTATSGAIERLMRETARALEKTKDFDRRVLMTRWVS